MKRIIFTLMVACFGMAMVPTAGHAYLQAIQRAISKVLPIFIRTLPVSFVVTQPTCRCRLLRTGWTVCGSSAPARKAPSLVLSGFRADGQGCWWLRVYPDAGCATSMAAAASADSGAGRSQLVRICCHLRVSPDARMPVITSIT